MFALTDLLADHRPYHDDVQIGSFIVTAAGTTPWGMYKQCLRELYKRWRGLKGLYVERELKLIEIDERDAKKDAENDDTEFDKRRNQVRLSKARLDLREIDINVADTERELIQFYRHAVALRQKIGEVTPEKRARLDREFWVHQAKERAAIDLLTCGHITEKTIGLIQYMPLDMRREVTGVMGDAAPLMAWYKDFTYETPELPLLEDDERERVLTNVRMIEVSDDTG